MKKLVLVLMVLLYFICGCNTEQQYILGQTFNDVEKIEVIYISPYQIYDNQSLIQIEADVIIQDANEESVFSGIKKISCRPYVHDPSWGIYGDVIRITYEDGAVDLVCAYGGLYYSAAGWKYRYVYLDNDAYNKIISNIVVPNSTGDGSIDPTDES